MFNYTYAMPLIFLVCYRVSNPLAWLQSTRLDVNGQPKRGEYEINF